MKRVTTGKGYLGQSDSVLYFGLGKESFANVEVIWPGNKSQSVGQQSLARFTMFTKLQSEPKIYSLLVSIKP